MSNTSRIPTCGTPSRYRYLEEGGIETFLRREVLPYAPDAWYAPDSVKIGYEISFTRHFYKPQPTPPTGGNSRRYPGPGTGDRGAIGRDRGREEVNG